MSTKQIFQAKSLRYMQMMSKEELALYNSSFTSLQVAKDKFKTLRKRVDKLNAGTPTGKDVKELDGEYCDLEMMSYVLQETVRIATVGSFNTAMHNLHTEVNNIVKEIEAYRISDIDALVTSVGGGITA